MGAVMTGLWACLAVVLQFVFAAFVLYRRVYVYGRGIPSKVEYRGRYIWEARGMACEYCCRLFLGHVCFVAAIIISLRQIFPANLALSCL